MDATEVAIPLLFWLVGLFLMWRVPTPAGRGRASDRDRDGPWVSVIIPARNEAQRIVPLLESLAGQTLRPCEVLVVDDNSSDGTADVARRYGARILEGEPLPEGWSGKSWACWQGAQGSCGERLVFLDADTWLEPSGLADLVAEQELRGGLLTVQPFHVTCRAYEQLSAFFNVVLMAALNAFTPLSNRLKPGGGFGPCAISSRRDYFQIGGHSVAKADVLEDIAMGKRFQRGGLPVSCCGGRGVISFRMYPAGLRDLIEGWSKGFGSGAAAIRIPFLILTVAWITGCFHVGLGLLRAGLTPVWPEIGLHALLYAIFALQIGWMLARVGRFRWWTPVLFPIPLVFFALVMLRSLFLIHIRHQVEWRGRNVST